MVLYLVSSRSLLSIVPGSLDVLRVLPTPDHVTVEAELRSSWATCPDCGSPSRRLHSRYPRVLRDLPWQGRPATIRVLARRFHCLATTCARKTFAEPLGAVAPVSARRTTRLGELQRHVGLALGGEAAARLALRLAIPTSPDTLLRMVARPVNIATPRPETRVLGVDDWAWRRGHRYGTILVDLERNVVLDLLGDRQAETLANWLRQRPGIEIVARDRAGAYADGIRQGAPNAVQVADRWHLLRNLGDAVRAVVDRHHGEIGRAARQFQAQSIEPEPNPAPPPPDASMPTLTASQRRSQDVQGRRHARYQQAAQLRTAGASISRIAAVVGTERKTIRGWLRAGGAPSWRKPPRASILTPHHGYLEERWAGGCHNAALLWRELVTRGFRGRSGVVRKWAEDRRARTACRAHPIPVHEACPSGRHLARLLLADTGATSNADQSFVAHLLEQIPRLADAVVVAKRLHGLLRKTSSDSLLEILDAAADTPLKELASSLRRDRLAIQAALDLPWTTSPVEGQVNRLKMLKRTMYGRAGFQLLRERVLHAA